MAKRLSKNCSYEVIFKTARQDYEDALIKSRANDDLKYAKNLSTKPNTAESNPSFSKYISLNTANFWFSRKHAKDS